MLLIYLGNIIILRFLRYWRAKNLIKTTKKRRGIVISIISLVSTMGCLVICIFEELSFSIIPYYYNHYFCENYNNNNYNNSLNTTSSNDSDIRISHEECKNEKFSFGEIFFTFFTFSCVELYSFFGMFILGVLIKRIIKGSDGPLLDGVRVGERVMYDKYGREVIVVKPGQFAVIDGKKDKIVPKEENTNQYYNINTNHQINNDIQNNINNKQTSQNISNQINPQNPDSQEYKLKGNV